MGRFLRPSISAVVDRLTNYAHREVAPCDLSLVCGPFIWEEEVREALAAFTPADMRVYGSPDQDPELLERLAAHEGLGRENLHLTPGADLAIESILDHFLEEGDTLGILEPSFPRFEIVAAMRRGVKVRHLASLAEAGEDLRMLVVCTPCNPSTKEEAAEEMESVAAGLSETLLVCDGAFDWYAAHPLAELCRRHDNVLAIKSFSKIGLAGLRLGYAMGHTDLVADLQLGFSPFAVPELVQAVGRRIIGGIARVQEIKQRVESAFVPVAQAFGERAVRLSPVPFYNLRTDRPAAQAAAALLAEGIMVVSGDHFRALPPGTLRIAVGEPAENQLLIDAVDRLGLFD